MGPVRRIPPRRVPIGGCAVPTPPGEGGGGGRLEGNLRVSDVGSDGMILLIPYDIILN